MSAHTPGPWRITRSGKSPCAIEADTTRGYALAKVYLANPETRKRAPEYEANAALIAAAPDLLAALEIALDDPDSEILGTDWERIARAAIAKATGAQP